jgi:hypothetical protein
LRWFQARLLSERERREQQERKSDDDVSRHSPTSIQDAQQKIWHERFLMSPNAAVERPHDHVPSAPRVHNEVPHMRRACAAVSRSAPTAC